MSAPRFYCPPDAVTLAPGARFALPDALARHAVRVLRLPPGATLTLFDGTGGEYPATIEHIDREQVRVALGQHSGRESESPLHVTLAQALQAADKMDYTLQKAVELGVNVIQPLSSRRSVVKLDGERAAKRGAHWQGVVTSACEQCGRNQVPVVAPVLPLPNWLGQLAGTPPAAGHPPPLRLMLAPGATRTLHDVLPTSAAGSLPLAIILLVGAEGGLDPQEISMAEQAGFIAIRLGPRILRTETAGLAAMAAMQTLWGDFVRKC